MSTFQMPGAVSITAKDYVYTNQLLSQYPSYEEVNVGDSGVRLPMRKSNRIKNKFGKKILDAMYATKCR